MMNILNIFKYIKRVKLNRLMRNTQINKGIDLYQDRKQEIAEFYGTTVEKILEIHLGPNQHELFDDISTDEKLFEAYQKRTMKATVSHMLSYNRYKKAFCLLSFCNKKFGKKKRSAVKVMDYGCSIADYGLVFAIAGYSVTLCDIISGNINVGKWRFDKRNFGYNFIEVGLSNLYPKIEMTDFIIAGEVLEHLRNPRMAIENICNGLRSKGFFWTSGYPVINPEIGNSHPDHLIEAAKMRDDVLIYLERNFDKIKIAHGYLFQKN